MLPYAAHFLNAFLLCVVLVVALQRLPAPLSLVDRPTERKVHIGLVPLTGGLAMFIAFVSALMLLGRPLEEHGGLVAGLSLLVAVGVADDAVDLRPFFKLGAQLIAAALMLVPGWRVIDSVGQVAGGEALQLGIAALPVSLFFVVGVINAVNMVDGIDGLAGGVVATTLFWFALTAGSFGRQAELTTILLLFFATLGFLVFNLRTPWRPRASVFMGDAGSMMLGASVAYFAILLNTKPHPGSFLPESAPLWALCWMMVLPATDTLSLIVRRLVAGGSPFEADRRHLHHLLLEAGLQPAQVTALLVAISAVMGGIGFAGIVFHIPDSAMALGLLLPLAAHTAFVLLRPAREKEPMPAASTSDAAVTR